MRVILVLGAVVLLIVVVAAACMGLSASEDGEVLPLTPVASPSPVTVPTFARPTVPGPGGATPTSTVTPAPIPKDVLLPAPRGARPLSVDAWINRPVPFMLRDGTRRFVTVKATNLVFASPEGVTVWATATVEVTGQGLKPASATIPAAFLQAPVELNDVRVFVEITKDFNSKHLRDGGGTKADARLLLSDARYTLSDLSKYRWPYPTLIWQEGSNHTYYQSLQGQPGQLYNHGAIDVGAPRGTPLVAWVGGTLQIEDRGFDYIFSISGADDGRPSDSHQAMHLDTADESLDGKRVDPGDFLGGTGRAAWWHTDFRFGYEWGPLLMEWYMADADPVRLSFIKDWLVAGPYQNPEDGTRLSKPYLNDEARLAPAKDAAAAGGRSWKPWDNLVPGVVLVGETVDPYPNSGWAYAHGNYVDSAAYLATYVYSPKAGQVVLNVGSSDPVKVWVDDQVVLEEGGCVQNGADREKPTIVIDQFKVPVRLRQGWNRLLVKTAQRNGCPISWQLAVRFSDDKGRPVEGLVTSPAKSTERPAGRPRFLTGAEAPHPKLSRDPLPIRPLPSRTEPELTQEPRVTAPSSVLTTPTLTVDTGTEVARFDPRMRGVAMNNWNWLTLRDGGGFMDDPKRLQALQDATSYLKPGIIRFAGGLWANNTGWDREGKPPQDGKWAVTDSTGKRHVYTHKYFPQLIDSYAAFAKRLGAETVFQVNICDDNPQMWADLVRYTNVEHGYKFKYWELGNEIDLNGCATVDEYVDRFVRYRAALKAVDPSIKVMGPAPSSPQEVDWLKALTARLGKDLDALSWHWYPLTEWTSNQKAYAYQGGSVDSLLAHHEVVGAACQNGFGCPGETIPAEALDVRRYRRGIAESMKQQFMDPLGAANSKLEFAITEMGPHSSQHETAINSNHLAAVWLADMLGRWAYNGLDMLTYYSLEDGSTGFGNSRGLLGAYDDKVLDVRPIYLTELLYAQHFGDRMVKTTTNEPDERVTVWASRDSNESGTLKLMAVNLSKETVNAKVSIKGFVPVSGEAYVLTSGNPTSMEDPLAFTEHTTAINGVVLPDYQVDDPSAFRNAVSSIKPRALAAGPDFTYQMPPYSVAAITLKGSYR